MMEPASPDRLEPIRDQTRLIQELEQAVRARDDLLAMASHDLRNHLAAIKLKLDSILRHPPAPLDLEAAARQWERLQTMQMQMDRMIELLNRLLDISRIGAGLIDLELEPVDLAALAREAAQRLQEEMQRAGCALDVRADAPVIGLWDRTRLAQVIGNLLSNALRYGAGQPVTITVMQDDRGQGVLSVADRGPGIPPDQQERLFERYARGTEERSPGSFGLGLWIARRICEALGGSITLTSAPGAGATFTVVLPLGGPPRPGRAPAVGGAGQR